MIIFQNLITNRFEKKNCKKRENMETLQKKRNDKMWEVKE